MTSGKGHIDSIGNICLKFRLAGLHSAATWAEYEGVIDTGFSGFIQLPIQYAFSLKLPLDGIVSATLADGNTISNLTALGMVDFMGKQETGSVILSMTSPTILVGMDFLRRLRFGLTFIGGDVTLLDEEELARIAQFLRERAEQGSPPQESEEPE